MRFVSPLTEGRLIRRYKRFLADVERADGSIVTAHCANPGSMMGLSAAGSRVLLAASDNPARKLAWSWKLIERDFGWIGPQWVGIDTGHPNILAQEAILSGAIPALDGYGSLRREVRYGVNSRIDLLLEGEKRGRCYVEVKNVHLMRTPGLAEFPDSVTARGAKHLRELTNIVAGGDRAVMLYIVQMAAQRLSFAADIDPAYAEAFKTARAAGVEALAYACDVRPDGIDVAGEVEIVA